VLKNIWRCRSGHFGNKEIDSRRSFCYSYCS